MRAELESALRDASSEAERAFGSAEVYIEKLVERPRHIEIQVIGDQHGNLVHLGERECSIQRRHQKVIEECPSPAWSTIQPEMREKWARRPLRRSRGRLLQRRHGRVSGRRAGNFYFLEMNTRLQVEHPVTELVTGLDLVHLQVRHRRRGAASVHAGGHPLAGLRDRVPHLRGGPEQRIPALYPVASPRWSVRTVPGFRLDSGMYPGVGSADRVRPAAR